MRNKIYNELFEGPYIVWLERTRWACQHPIPTAILYANRQINAEASVVLYNQITGQLVVFCRSDTFKYNIFRINEPNPKMKYMRSGRAITTTPYAGNVHPHMIARMQDLEISLVWDFHDKCKELTHKCPGESFNQYVRALLSSSICRSMSSTSAANGAFRTLTLKVTDWLVHWYHSEAQADTDTSPCDRNPDPLSFDQEIRYEQRLIECLALHNGMAILSRLCDALGRTFQLKGPKITPEYAKQIGEEFNGMTMAEIRHTSCANSRDPNLRLPCQP